MFSQTTIMITLALSVGFIHTITGPDHYLPFIAMSKARRWSLSKTMLITTLCGIGHILSSVILGVGGIAFGVAVGKLQIFEAVRGSFVAWGLFGFGLAYTLWGLRQAMKNKENVDYTNSKKDMAFWVLFLIFVFGPCEPLIPVLMYPAATGSWFDVFVVTAVFGLTTIGTMLGIVFAAVYGTSFIKESALNRWGHALAGVAVTLSGAAIVFLGL